MPRKSRLTPEVQAAFLAALRGGALVEAAAAGLGLPLSTLYWRRRRDPGFDSAWTAAAEAIFGFAWRTEEKRRGRGRRVRVATKRRVRFGATRRGLYLASLGRSCDTKASARWAGVWRSTVYRALKRDPGFALANGAALERGYGWLEREAARARAHAAERMMRAVERAAAAIPADRHERHIRRMKRGWRPDRPGAWRAAPPGRTPAEAIPELKRKLRRIELAGWKRGRGPPSRAGGALRA